MMDGNKARESITIVIWLRSSTQFFRTDFGFQHTNLFSSSSSALLWYQASSITLDCGASSINFYFSRIFLFGHTINWYFFMIQPFDDGERVTKMNWLNYNKKEIIKQSELSIDRAKWPELARRSMNLSPLIDISPLSISNEWLSRIVVFLARARLSVHYEFWSRLTYADHVVPTSERDEVGRKWKYLHFEIIFVCCCCLLFS